MKVEYDLKNLSPQSIVFYSNDVVILSITPEQIKFHDESLFSTIEAVKIFQWHLLGGFDEVVIKFGSTVLLIVTQDDIRSFIPTNNDALFGTLVDFWVVREKIK